MVDQRIWQNAITPGVYIHIVTGKKAKDVLSRKTHRAHPSTQHQVNRLHKAGFHKIKGLTDIQSDELLHIAETEYRQGKPEPWKLQALMNEGFGSNMSIKERHEYLRNTTRKRANELLGLS